MKKSDNMAGVSELREARRENRKLLWAAGFFSIFVNLLMLTGPLFMLQTYDRVLGARSEETLVALFILVAILFLIMGIIDWARGWLLTRIGARFQARLDRRVFDAVLKKSAVDRDEGKIDMHGTSGQQLKDLEAVQRFYASPVFAALFDVPWTPVFLIGISIFHPWLGALAVAGGTVLILLTVFNQLSTRTAAVKSAAASHQSDRYSDHLKSDAETIRSLGMQANAFAKWHEMRARSLEQGVRTQDLGGTFSTATKTFRLFLQSMMLALGAYLVLLGQVTPGVMIAGSILLGRALAPVEQVVNQWAMIQRARRGWDNLAELLSEVPEDDVQIELPRPSARIDVQQLTVIPPGGRQATLRLVSFSVVPGEAVGVIGSSGSGKSTLARALTGVWQPAGGKIRLDGAALNQYHPESLARYIGYLPQKVSLFDGTIAENIARLAKVSDSDKVVAAARQAAAHEMILKLPQGYDTPVQSVGTQLSGGQIQRIGLARALYDEPVLLVLDEPNSNLDNEGSNALNSAIKQVKARKGAVLIMAHRPAAIKECEKLLVLEEGARKAWGTREQVLAETVANYKEVRKAASTGMV
ncbi:Type I secretion system ATP-binding protein PrsD (plasmid) [Roseovarius sp. THAF27]|uniref:type I secretion system permease/ATPase n=1 Tax=unclassified Roseovarius TaxID=2614913 RepID=UPI001268DA9E|nr:MULTISPECIES: type I secretion system permease/ATPase [unclassified Roseovarius]QFT83270.1 Type I secretion system ATP-binding protein PrsD [Roseovarius sp. THAF27]QFT99924.1 Type I secretion system ATP-binding protein PrsD [Roseovarius sp. THAF8]